MVDCEVVVCSIYQSCGRMRSRVQDGDKDKAFSRLLSGNMRLQRVTTSICGISSEEGACRYDR